MLSIADEECHIDKARFRVPFVCGCRDLGEGLRRIAEGAAMLRSKGEAGTGNIIEAVRHARAVQRAIRGLGAMDEAELYGFAKTIAAPLELVRETRRLGRLPVVMFAAGGIATPADAALMMQLGVDGVFVGSGIFKSGDPVARGKAIVAATTHFNNPKVRRVARVGRCWQVVGVAADDSVAVAGVRACRRVVLVAPARARARGVPPQPRVSRRPPVFNPPHRATLPAAHRRGVQGAGRRHVRHGQHQGVAGGVPRAGALGEGLDWAPAVLAIASRRPLWGACSRVR